MPIKKAEKDIGSPPIKPPTDKELGIGDDWLDEYDSYDDADSWEWDEPAPEPVAQIPYPGKKEKKEYVQPVHPQFAKDLKEQNPDEWDEIKNEKGEVVGLQVNKTFDLDKAKQVMAKLQNLKYNKECTADAHEKVAKKLYKKQPIMLMVHDSMTITKPAFMEKPKPGDCVCDDCQHAFIDQLQAYDDYLDDLKHFEEVSAQIKLDALKAEVLSKQQTLAEKKKIAEEYLAKEAEKKAKSGGNPLLIVKPAESSFNSLLQKATSVKGSSHDKSGPYGGSSSYTDADVVQARSYMQSVLGVESLSINGRALEHILAEVYGFAKRDSAKEIMALKAKQKNQDQLEMQITQLKTTLGTTTEALEQLQAEAKENEKFLAVSKKLDKETVAKTSTGRRIKE